MQLHFSVWQVLHRTSKPHECSGEGFFLPSLSLADSSSKGNIAVGGGKAWGVEILIFALFRADPLAPLGARLTLEYIDVMPDDKVDGTNDFESYRACLSALITRRLKPRGLRSVVLVSDGAAKHFKQRFSLAFESTIRRRWPWIRSGFGSFGPLITERKYVIAGQVTRSRLSLSLPFTITLSRHL